MTSKMPRTIYVTKFTNHSFWTEQSTHHNFTQYTNTEALIAELEGMKQPLPERLTSLYVVNAAYNAAIDAVIEKVRGK